MGLKTRKSAKLAFAEFEVRGVQLSELAVLESSRLNATVNGDWIWRPYHNLRNLRADFVRLGAVPGIDAEGRKQEGGSYSVNDEITAILVVIDAAMDEVDSFYPKDAEGWHHVKKSGAGGAPEFLQITAAQSAPFRGLLDAIAVSVE